MQKKFLWVSYFRKVEEFPDNLQNQKTRKLCTFIYLELKLSQFSRDLKNQKVGPHPPPTIKIKKTAQRAWTPGRFC